MYPLLPEQTVIPLLDKQQSWKTRVKLAVTSPSRHFRDLAKKTPTRKRADKLKKYSKKHIMAKS